MKYLHERRRASAATCRSRRAKADESFAGAGAGDLPGRARPTAGARDQHHAGLRALPDGSCCATRPSARSRADRPGRGRTFGMEGLFRQIGIYNPRARKYTPVDKDQVMYYREDKERPDPAGGHQRGRRHELQLDRRGDVVLDEQPHHGAVLHLLLDVRLPARRRPGLGRRRHAGARLPARRHQGRTTLNGEGLQHEDGHSHILAGTIPNCVRLRPDLRARGRRDHPPRPQAHGREARTTSSTT